jgi:peptidoglycan/xylan/chitin deacetylase (PgdA/CDA1 family)
MIQLEPAQPPLSTAEQLAADTILDVSRLLRTAEITDLDVVRLRLLDRPVASDVKSLRAANWHFEVGDGEVRAPRQLMTIVATWLGRAEQRANRLDRYGRVLPEENPLVAEREERHPIVAYVAIALRNAVAAAAGPRAFRLLAPWPNGKRWAAAFTHDLDIVALWPAFTALRVVELLRKMDLGRTGNVLAAALRSVGRNPVHDAVKSLLEIEQRDSVRSTWFIICGTPTFATRRGGDITYNPESAAARRIISEIQGAGHEIGLHGSFETYDHGDRFLAQRQRLERITGRPARGVRQHYLRMQPGRTQRSMAAAEFTYDSTFGFADRNGFRLGIADVVGTFDDESGERLAIDEVPFVWMDRALSKYRRIEEPNVWIDDALALAEVCRATEGLWVGIWHPNLSPALGFPGAPAAYARLIRAIVDERAHIDTLGSLVDWRRARRAARATAIDAQGLVVLEKIDAGLRLENSAGESLPDLAAAS